MSESLETSSFNLYPDYELLSKAFTAFIRHAGWEKFVILYKDAENLLRLEQIFKLSSVQGNKIMFGKLESDESPPNYRPILERIKRRENFNNIVLDCDIEEAKVIIDQASSLDMLSSYHKYFLTSLDIELLDIRRSHPVNITGYRVINPNNPLVKKFVREYRGRKKFTPIKTELALIYDSVFALTNALEEANKGHVIRPTPLSCSKSDAWEDGSTINNLLANTRLNGLSGRIEFVDGKRKNLQLDLVEINFSGQMEKVGYWNESTGLNITRNYSQLNDKISESLQNKTLRVTTIAVSILLRLS